MSVNSWTSQSIPSKTSSLLDDELMASITDLLNFGDTSASSSQGTVSNVGDLSDDGRSQVSGNDQDLLDNDWSTGVPPPPPLPSLRLSSLPNPSVKSSFASTSSLPPVGPSPANQTVSPTTLTSPSSLYSAVKRPPAPPLPARRDSLSSSFASTKGPFSIPSAEHSQLNDSMSTFPSSVLLLQDSVQRTVSKPPPTLVKPIGKPVPPPPPSRISCALSNEGPSPNPNSQNAKQTSVLQPPPVVSSAVSSAEKSTLSEGVFATEPVHPTPVKTTVPPPPPSRSSSVSLMASGLDHQNRSVQPESVTESYNPTINSSLDNHVSTTTSAACSLTPSSTALAPAALPPPPLPSHLAPESHVSLSSQKNENVHPTKTNEVNDPEDKSQETSFNSSPSIKVSLDSPDESNISSTSLSVTDSRQNVDNLDVTAHAGRDRSNSWGRDQTSPSDKSRGRSRSNSCGQLGAKKQSSSSSLSTLPEDAEWEDYNAGGEWSSCGDLTEEEPRSSSRVSVYSLTSAFTFLDLQGKL